jgi:16S rRNA (guanine527-N7)-methyltransferase
MNKARIAELLRPFLSSDLSAGQLASISMYIDILGKWNQKMNLTAVRQPEKMVTRHFGESLFAAQALFPADAGTAAPGRPAEQSSATQPATSRATLDGAIANGATISKVPRVVDVGSGAGFPGLPIKIWAPDIRLTLIESNHKKATFLKEVARALSLEGAEVFTGRAETFPVASADVVTLRAVERFGNILPIAAGLVRPGGRLSLLVGSAQIKEATVIGNDMEWQASIPVPQSNHRALLSGHKR